MSMQRRSFLLASAGAAVGGVALLGARGASADNIGALRAAPTTTFAVGVRQFNWMRGSRQLATSVYYPAAGNPGGNPIANAPVAAGVFPLCVYQHGLGGTAQGSLGVIRPLAAAGFIVPALSVPGVSIGDTYNGELPRDNSEVITRALALNSGSDPLAGHIDGTVGVGMSGHSMGGMTTHAMLTAFPEPRIKAAVPMSCVDMGNPSSRVSANVMFQHGDRDPTCPYSSARQAYSELSPTKAFVTFVGANHGSYWANAVAIRTLLDWMRWSLYGDAAARDRLAADATTSSTRWEFVPGNVTTSTTTAAATTTTAAATTTTTTTGAATTTTSSPGGEVSATYRTANTWPGGYQAEVTVTAGDAPIEGWTVSWALGSGQSISQLWNGELSLRGSAVTVRNAPYNRSLAAHASTTFGFLGTGAPATPSLTVTTP